MKIYISKSHDPYLNQSIEYQLVANQNEKEDILLLWLNSNAIIIGRNQNIFNEINEEYVKEKQIKVARRHSGGGAVYHDLGNILFSLINQKDDKHSYEMFLKPIIKFLQSLGVNAEFHGRNDVLVDGMKISGNAQFLIKNKLATHGTLLFDTDLSVLGKSLITNKHKLESKGIKSNRSRVTNIKKHIEKEMNSQEFLNKLVEHFESNGNGKIVEISPEIMEDAKKMAEEMKSFDWIYGKSPIAKIHNKIKFTGGNISAFLDIKDGKIANIKIEGDFLSQRNIADLYPLLNGTIFSESAIEKCLKNIELKEYLGSITLKEFINVICGK